MNRLTHLVWAAALAATASCGTQGGSGARVDYDEADFREGDVLLRYGRGMESRFVGVASGGGFSHMGLLHLDSARGWMVVHAVPGEMPPRQPDVVKVEPVDSFFLTERASQGGVAHVDCDSAKRVGAVAYALAKAGQRVPFDHDYRLSDTTALYCTELVWMSYLSQGIDLTDGQRTYMPAMSTDSEYILPTDIVEGRHIGRVVIYKAVE